MRETTSSRTEILALLLADDFPAWSDEPLHDVVSHRLGIPARDAKAELATIARSTRVSLSAFGRIEETWLYRADATPAATIDGVAEIVTLEGGGASLVRTAARDAVDRERLLRAIHSALHERPALQLHRTSAPPPKRKLNVADGQLILALRADPWAPVATLAERAKLTQRATKTAIQKLLDERILTLDTTPAEGLAHIVLHLKPSSTAAARHALAAAGGIVRAWLPAAGEAAHVDALAHGAPDLAAMREALGVARVEARRIASVWRNDALADALVKRATGAGA